MNTQDLLMHPNPLPPSLDTLEKRLLLSEQKAAILEDHMRSIALTVETDVEFVRLTARACLDEIKQLQ
jgi:hypothetical protein